MWLESTAMFHLLREFETITDINKLCKKDCREVFSLIKLFLEDLALCLSQSSFVHVGSSDRNIGES